MKTKIIKSVGIVGVDFNLSVFEMIELAKRVNIIREAGIAIDNGQTEGKIIDDAHKASYELAVFASKLCCGVDDIIKDCSDLFTESIADVEMP